jgi:hypothetical protein
MDFLKKNRERAGSDLAGRRCAGPAQIQRRGGAGSGIQTCQWVRAASGPDGRSGTELARPFDQARIDGRSSSSTRERKKGGGTLGFRLGSAGAHHGATGRRGRAWRRSWETPGDWGSTVVKRERLLTIVRSTGACRRSGLVSAMATSSAEPSQGKRVGLDPGEYEDLRRQG